MFADQPMIAEKLEQLLHLAKKIEPTLDVNDSTTMKESLGNMQQRYGEVTKAAAEKDDWLSKAADDWTEYQVEIPSFYSSHIVSYFLHSSIVWLKQRRPIQAKIPWIQLDFL